MPNCYISIYYIASPEDRVLLYNVSDGNVFVLLSKIKLEISLKIYIRYISHSIDVTDLKLYFQLIFSVGNFKYVCIPVGCIPRVSQRVLLLL